MAPGEAHAIDRLLGPHYPEIEQLAERYAVGDIGFDVILRRVDELLEMTPGARELAAAGVPTPVAVKADALIAQMPRAQAEARRLFGLVLAFAAVPA